MSSYLYDNLKKALGGDIVTSSKSSVISNWTPNNIKAILISRNYIVIMNHLGFGGNYCRQFNLDINEVSKDLDILSKSCYANPKLNSLLNKRVFSCLEEIYVDGMFQNYSGVLDVKKYAESLLASDNRLRFYGYGNFPEGDMASYINELARRAKMQGTSDFSIAKSDRDSKFVLQYEDVGNEEWYHKYYLRPQFYKLDAPRGNLAIHFRKIEDLVEREGKLNEETKKQNLISAMLKELVKADFIDRKILRMLENLIRYLIKDKDFDLMKQIILPVILTVFRNNPKVGLSLALIDKLFGGLSLQKEDSDFMKSQYKGLKVIGDKDTKIDTKLIEDKYKKGEGLINTKGLLDEICCNVTKVLMSKGFKDMVGMAITSIDTKNLPDGEFKRTYTTGGKTEGKGNTEVYLSYLCEIVGCDVESLK